MVHYLIFFPFFSFTTQGQEPAKLILVAEMLCAKTVQMELIVAFVRKATRVILFEDVSVSQHQSKRIGTYHKRVCR